MEKIITGNDFRLIVDTQKMENRASRFDLNQLERCEIYLVKAGRARILQSYTLDDVGRAIIDVDGDALTTGTWGVEIVGTYLMASIRSTNAKAFQIVDGLNNGGMSGDGLEITVDVLILANSEATRPYVDYAIAEHDANTAAHPTLQAAIDEKVADVKINGTSVVDGGKVANVTMPTKVSDLDNDSEYTTKTYVDAQVSAAGRVDDVEVNGTSVLDGKTAKITMPTKTSDLSNDSDFATNASVDAKVATAGHVDDVQVNGASVVSGKVANVAVPTKVSDITNDSGFQDATQVQQAVDDAIAANLITGVNVSIDSNTGTPSATVTKNGNSLDFAFHNMKGNGITDIEVDEQVGDEAVNTVTIKTDADQEGTEFQVRNGSRGNGIASIEQTTVSTEDRGVNVVTITDENDVETEVSIRNGSRGNGIESSSEVLSDQDGGTNTFTFIDTDGNEHVLLNKNGRKGDKGNPGTYIDPANVEIFNSPQDLDGKTSAQMEAMVPSGNIISSIEQVIGTVSYETKTINNDFSTGGYYQITENDIVYNESANWKCKIVPIDELSNTTAVAVTEQAYLGGDTGNIPPIIYLSSATPSLSNYVGEQFGTHVMGTGSSKFFGSIEGLTIPVGATYAIINNHSTIGSSSTITYRSGVSIREDLLAFESKVDEKFEKLENRFVVVDKNGNGNYTSIGDAIDGTQDGDTIIVNAGVYEEDVHMWGKTRHIVGVCRETCILTNGTGNYQTPPLEANIGSITNMTIIADNYDPTILDPTENQVLPSYGIHIEYPNSTAYKLTIRNCKIVSKWSAALGIGLRYNQTVEIIDCELISNCVRIYSNFAGHWVEMGGLFFHNDNSNNVSGTGKLIVRNSRLQGKKAALVMEAVNKTTMVDAEFGCNTLISEDYGVGNGIIYRYDNMETQMGYLCGNKITLGIASHSNNISELNA